MGDSTPVLIPVIHLGESNEHSRCCSAADAALPWARGQLEPHLPRVPSCKTDTITRTVVEGRYRDCCSPLTAVGQLLPVLALSRPLPLDSLSTLPLQQVGSLV
jgi:hypothetical protein